MASARPWLTEMRREPSRDSGRRVSYCSQREEAISPMRTTGSRQRAALGIAISPWPWEQDDTQGLSERHGVGGDGDEMEVAGDEHCGAEADVAAGFDDLDATARQRDNDTAHARGKREVDGIGRIDG